MSLEIENYAEELAQMRQNWQSIITERSQGVKQLQPVCVAFSDLVIDILPFHISNSTERAQNAVLEAQRKLATLKKISELNLRSHNNSGEWTAVIVLHESDPRRSIRGESVTISRVRNPNPYRRTDFVYKASNYSSKRFGEFDESYEIVKTYQWVVEEARTLRRQNSNPE